MVAITALAGHNVGFTEEDRIGIPMGADYGLDSDISLRSRINQPSVFEHQTARARAIQLLLQPGSSAPVSTEEWRENAFGRYRPLEEVIYLQGNHRGIPVRIPALIQTLSNHPESRMAEGNPPILLLTIIPLDPIWETVAPTAVALASSGSVTPGGNYPTQPVLSVMPTGGYCTRRRAIVTPHNPGGLKDYPIRLTLDTTSTSTLGANRIMVFHNGLAVPFLAQGYNTTTTDIDVLCTTHGEEPNFFDVFYGGGVDNQITAQKFDPSGFDLAHPDFSNDTWVYRGTEGTIEGVVAPSMFDIFRAVNRPGAWVPATKNVNVAGLSFQVGVYSISPDDSIQFNTSTISGQFADDADGMVITLPVPARISGATVVGLGVPLGGAVASDAQYIRAGDARWRNSTILPAFEITAPLAIALRISPDISSHPSLTLQQAGSVWVYLEPTLAPTVTWEDPVFAARINDSITNTLTGDEIRLVDLYTDQVPLVIDCYTGKYAPETGSIMYCASPAAGVKFTAKRGGWPLRNGVANTWIAGDFIDVAMTYKDRYAA